MTSRSRAEKALTHDRLLELLHYEPETGVFTRLSTVNIRSQRGMQAGSISTLGYRLLGIDYHRFYEHRVAWFYVHKEWPPHTIDHIDGDRANNRLSNLRLATLTDNNRNKPVRSTSQTGFKGVKRVGRRFRAQIDVNGRSIHLGYFASPEDAHCAYCKAADEMHGDFARYA